MIFARDFFDLQLSFAKRVGDLSGLSLETALIEYTNLYVRLGFGRAFDRDHEGWKSYRVGLLGAGDEREWTYRFYRRAPELKTAPCVVATFGCFSYAVPDGNHVRLHFRSTEAEDGSALGAARIQQRRAELSALCAHLKPRLSRDIPVVGASWMYNLEAYRRVFPPAYTSTRSVMEGGFRSMALWGQFTDRHGEVRESVAGPFSSALAQTSALGELGSCFPFQVLTARAPAYEFFDFYGI